MITTSIPSSPILGQVFQSTILRLRLARALALVAVVVFSGCDASDEPDVSGAVQAVASSEEACRHSDASCGDNWIASPPELHDVCRWGRVILQERVQADARHPRRHSHALHRVNFNTETFSITPSEPAICVSLINGDENAEHRVEHASAHLSPGESLCEGCVKRLTTISEHATPVTPGSPLDLRVGVRGNKHGDFVDVIVREGGDIARDGVTQSVRGPAKIEVFNERVPQIMSLVETTLLHAEATLLQLNDGLISRNGDLQLRSSWEILSKDDCTVVRHLDGESDVEKPWTFSLTASFDGRDDQGALLPSGAYGVRLVLSLVREKRGHHKTKTHELARVSSPVMRTELVVESPWATIVTPENGGRLEVPQTYVAASGSYVDIPPGAVSEPTLITIAVAAGDVEPPGVAVSVPLKVESSGEFSEPVTVALRYDEQAVALAGSTEDLIGLYVLHTGATAWSKLSDAAVDSAQHLITSPIDGFSIVQAFVENHDSEAQLLGTSSASDIGVTATAAQIANMAYGFDGALHLLARGLVGNQQHAFLGGVSANASSRLLLDGSSPALTIRQLVEVDDVVTPGQRPTEITAIASGGRDNTTVVSQCDKASSAYPCIGTECRCRLVVIRDGQGE